MKHGLANLTSSSSSAPTVITSHIKLTPDIQPFKDLFTTLNWILIIIMLVLILIGGIHIFSGESNVVNGEKISFGSKLIQLAFTLFIMLRIIPAIIIKVITLGWKKALVTSILCIAIIFIMFYVPIYLNNAINQGLYFDWLGDPNLEQSAIKKFTLTYLLPIFIATFAFVLCILIFIF